MRDRYRASVCYSRDSSRENYQTKHKSIAQQQRLATETNEERTAILHDMRASQLQCLATESQEVRDVRLNHLRENRITAQHRRHTLEQEHVAHEQLSSTRKLPLYPLQHAPLAWSWVVGELQNGMYEVQPRQAHSKTLFNGQQHEFGSSASR